MGAEREAIGELPNPLGLDGIEFVEYATTPGRRWARCWRRMGFRPVARHARAKCCCTARAT